MAQFATIMARLFSNEDTVRPVRLDDSGGLLTIPFENVLARQGNFYGTGYDDPLVLDGNFIDVLIQTGPLKDLHAFFSGAVGADSVGELYEDPVRINNGTALPINNYNRQSSNTPNARASHSPSLTSPGTLVVRQRLPGGTGSNSPGDTTNITTRVPIVLKRSTFYVARITNLSGGPTWEQINLSFYEE